MENSSLIQLVQLMVPLIAGLSSIFAASGVIQVITKYLNKSDTVKLKIEIKGEEHTLEIGNGASKEEILKLIEKINQKNA